MEQISLLKENYYDRALALWEASVRATHYFISDDDIAFFRTFVKERLQSAPMQCIILPTGELCAIMAVSDDMIDMLFVHPAHFRKGFGKLLLEYAVENLSAKAVDVNEQNIDAVHFYRKSGFTQTGRSETDGFGKPFPILHLAKI